MAVAHSTTRCGWSGLISRDSADERLRAGVPRAHRAGGEPTMMQYSCSVAMIPIDELIEIAKTAEEVGFDSIALPDSIFYMEKQSADYPYTADGSRMWNADTPWADPLIVAGTLGAVTSTLRFYTNVMKLGSRNPLLLAR